MGWPQWLSPTLFPFGKGDPTNRARQHGITLTEAFKHLIKFAEKLENDKFEWSLLLTHGFLIGH